MIAALPAAFALDILYGMLTYFGAGNVPMPGALLRAMVMAVSLYWVFRWPGQVALKYSTAILLLFGMSGPVSAALEGGSFRTLLSDAGSLTRVLFGPVLLYALAQLTARGRVTPRNLLGTLRLAAIVLSCGIVVPTVIGANLQTYGDYAYGSKGWVAFASNDVGLALGIGLAFATYNLVSRTSPSTFADIILIGTALAMLGTRAAITLLVVVPMIIVVTVAVGKPDRAPRMPKLGRRPALLLASFATLSILAYGASARMMESSFNEQRIAEISSGTLPRLALIEAGLTHIEHRSWLHNLIGEGPNAYQRGVYQYWNGTKDNASRLVEVDWFDLFGEFGLLFTALLYGLYLTYLARLVWIAISRRSAIAGVGTVAMGLFCAHSALAGHAMTSPTASTFAVAIMATLHQKPPRRSPL